MARASKRKAAMLLASLDEATAKELLKGQPQDVIQEVAIELSHLEAAGQLEPEEAHATAREFCTTLQKVNSGSLHIKSFVNTLFKSSGGREKAAELHAQMQQAIRDKDPFIAITSASPGQIAAAMEGESAQAIALVLSSLPSKLGTDVLSCLEEEVRLKVIWRMANPGEISSRTVRRVGEMVCKRLIELTSDDMGAATGGFDENARRANLRKVALVLSGLPKESRDTLLEEIEGNDEETSNTVKALMVTWEDIVKIEDRSLQEVLRNIDSAILAKALHGAEPVIAEKIRSNISERAAEAIDEEAALMSEPRKKDVLAAKEEVVKPLRDANEKEELAFIEEE
ncbi:MAG: FliG C-terminal domain-containing protein [Planctomycetota bacterium]|jgi:flagellar motor switch protein FliG